MKFVYRFESRVSSIVKHFIDRSGVSGCRVGESAVGYGAARIAERLRELCHG